MAPMYHLFDIHEHCTPECCPAKAKKNRIIDDNKKMFDWLIENVGILLRSSKYYITD